MYLYDRMKEECHHVWEGLRPPMEILDQVDDMPTTIKIVYTCNKCGKVKISESDMFDDVSIGGLFKLMAVE